jgi:hypothetical protein
MSYEKLKAHMEALIAAHGMAVNPVEPSGKAPPFAYTIGQEPKGLPELIVFGLPPQVAGAMLYTMAGHMEAEHAAGRPMGAGFITVPDVPVRHALLEVSVAAASRYATVAHDRSEGKARYLQVIWPDESGLFPWESGYEDELRMYQVILGAPPAPARVLH